MSKMRVAIASVLVLALASMTAAKSADQTGAQLTSDQRSLVVHAIRAELASHAHGWTARTSLCLRIEVRDAEGMRRVQSPLEVLRRLNTEGRTVVAADRCIERTSSGTRGNGEIEFRAPNQSPAYLLEVEIPKTLGGSGSASVSISLKDKECAPLACDSIDTYTAQKTRNGWTVTYEGRMFE